MFFPSVDPVYLPRIKQYSYKKLKIDLLEVNGFRVGGICEGEVKRKELSFSCLFHADFNAFGYGFLEEGEGHQPLTDEKKAKYEVKSITANFSIKALLIW